MIKQFSVPGICLLLAVLPLKAQTPSNPSIGVGYVVITPTLGPGSGLTALETIANQQDSTVATTILSSTPLSTKATIIVNVGTGQNLVATTAQITGTGGITLGSLFANPTNAQLTSAGSSTVPLFSNTSISILNPNLTTVTITGTVTDSQGTSTALPSFTLGSLQQMSQFLNQFLDSATSITLPLNGAVTFSSNMPVAFTAFQFSGSSFATLPVVSGQTTASIPTLAPGIGGTGALLLPQFVSGGGWASQISIANLTNVQQTVQVDLFGSDGMLQASFPGQQLSPNGVFTTVPQ